MPNYILIEELNQLVDGLQEHIAWERREQTGEAPRRSLADLLRAFKATKSIAAEIPPAGKIFALEREHLLYATPPHLCAQRYSLRQSAWIAAKALNASNTDYVYSVVLVPADS